jgi:hypothetical protein
MVSFIELFPQKLNEFFLFPMLVMCPAHLVLLDLITLVLFGVEWKLWNSCLCLFPCCAIVSFLYITSLFGENLWNRKWRTAELWHLKISAQIKNVFPVNFHLPVAQYYLSFILILLAHFLRNSLGIPSVFNRHKRGSTFPLVQLRSFTSYAVAVYILWLHTSIYGARGGIVVKALRYKPAGSGFDSQWCHWNFSVT